MGEEVRGAVVVGCDGDPETDAALRFAAQEARQRSAPLIVLATFQASVDPDNDDFDIPTSVLAARARAAAEHALCRALSLPVEQLPQHRTVATSGVAWRVLLRDYGEAGLIVIGAHQRHLLARLLHGSDTGRDLVRRSHTPVVIVPPT